MTLQLSCKDPLLLKKEKCQWLRKRALILQKSDSGKTMRGLLICLMRFFIGEPVIDPNLLQERNTDMTVNIPLGKLYEQMKIKWEFW